MSVKLQINEQINNICITLDQIIVICVVQVKTLLNGVVCWQEKILVNLHLNQNCITNKYKTLITSMEYQV